MFVVHVHIGRGVTGLIIKGGGGQRTVTPVF